MTTIRARRGLGQVELVKSAHVGGTTYQQASWWAVNGEGIPLAGPQPSERRLRREVAGLRRLIASGEYAPR